MTNITIERVTGPTSELRALIDELNTVLGAAYEPHQRHGLAFDQLFEPHVRFFVARIDGSGAVGCGGVALFGDYAEVKRMYTRPAVRDRGVAKALLRSIEGEARAAGRLILRLETGIHQPEAMGLYRNAGFQPCGPFGAYAAMRPANIELSRFFEKQLSA